MHVNATRLAGATTLKVDVITRVPQKFIGTTGTPNAAGYINPTTKMDFYGHLSGSDIIIDGLLPGSTDNGNTTADVVIIKPNTAWADIVAQLAQQPSDWSVLSDSMAYSSVDGPTGVITVPTGAKNRYTVGKRLKFDQVQALTSYWPMDSSSADTKGSSTGTDTSMTYTSGKFSNAATFNGTTSKIVIADSAAMKPTGPFTLGMWFKTSAAGATQMLFQSYSQNTAVAGIRLWITSNKLDVTIGRNQVANSTYLDYVDTNIVGGSTVVTDGNWHYVVVSYQNNFVQVYLDGVLEVSSWTPAPVYAATNYVRIGCSNNTGSDTNFFSGQIDDVFLINGYALDENWVAAKYAATVAQSNADLTLTKYAIITKVADTQVTAYFGTDYGLMNAAISNPYQSGVASPSGFPTYPPKWTVKIMDVTERSQGTPVSGTWYNINGQSITVPIGAWTLRWTWRHYCSLSGVASLLIRSSLSLSTSTQTDDELSASSNFYSNAQGVSQLVSRQKFIRLAAKTTYYAISALANSGAGTLFWENNADTQVIEAVSAYL